jgi:multiple sugar transport system ATP-binding protein
MASLSLRHIYKVYPNGTKAVNDFNLEIKDKEFIVFVGPSGCGKSTTLRMIAGLEEITAGELYIDNQLVNDVEPKDRDIAMVFQNYALYPHMTVYDNMAFGLRLRHVPQEEIHKKVLWAAQILKLTDYLDRKPRAMSGGQRQRVALGRAILRNPKVFLLDEPLSNLDAKLRTEMRSEISKLHQALQTTFVYVTHDQVEAMTMGSRIVVMKLGFVQQVDTPTNLYNYPINKFVAGFIGTPQMNFFEATLKRENEKVTINFLNCNNSLTIPFNDLIKVQPSYLNGKRKVIVGLRCEHISISNKENADGNNVKLKISHFERLGGETLVYADMDMKGNGFDETSTRVISKTYTNNVNFKPGEIVNAHFDMAFASFFDAKTEVTIVPRVPETNVFDCSVKNNELSLLGNKIKLPAAMKCQDVEHAEVYIPTDAIDFNGNISAKVTNIETINEQKVCYLEIEKRTFFALIDKDYKIGSTVKIGFDFTQISIKKDDTDIISPISEYDEFIGNFASPSGYKSSNVSLFKETKSMCQATKDALKKKELDELEKISISSISIDRLKKEYKEQCHKAHSDYAFRVGTSDFGKAGKAKARQDYQDVIKSLTDKYNQDLASLKADQAKNASLGDQAKADNAKKVEVIKKSYADKYALIDNADKAFKEEIEKGYDSFYKDAKAKQNAEDKENVGKIKVLKEKYEHYRDEMEALFESKKATISKDDPEASIKLKNLKNEKNDKLLKEKHDTLSQIESIKDSGFTYYLNINGDFIEAPLSMASKIIQALGVGAISSTYRYLVKHDAYFIDDKNGFEAVCKGMLDYGADKYAVCEVNKKTIYVKCDKIMKIGGVIKLSINANMISVYEKKFDIRLY